LVFALKEAVDCPNYVISFGDPMSDESHDTDFLLENLMDNMTDMIYFKDRQSRFIMMNKAAATWQGFGHPADAIGTSDFDRYTEEDAFHMRETELDIITSGKPLEGVEEQETRQDGEMLWVSTTKMPLEDQDGNIVGTFGVSRDITEHKEAELRAAYYAEQVRSIKEEMEEDVRMAAELQKTFFPRTYPCFPSTASADESCVGFHHLYHASGMVSGDFCAVLRLSETESGIFLCDVMGHGVRAALGTALIYAMVQEISMLETDPGAFLVRMNELLLPILRQDDVFLYATACYMIFDAATGKVRLANAGHPVPLQFQSVENKVKWLMDDDSLRGPALAIAEDAKFPVLEKQLQPGDSVVMYTDGLYEVVGPDGEEFGEAQLLAAARRYVDLPLEELFPALVNAACEFTHSDGFDDDVCLVGFTFRKPVRESPHVS